MAKAATKEKETTDVALAPGAAGLPADALAAYAGHETGFEKDRSTDYIVPFLTILQGLSPQMETVEGAKLGKIINVATNEMYDYINMVVVRKEYKFCEWAPNRGGLVAVHDPESDFIKKLQSETEDQFNLVTKEGNEVKEVKYIVGVQCTDEKKPMGFATVGFSVTKIKKFNAWNQDARNKLGQFALPLHALVWRFGVFKDKNKKGEFYNWNHSLLGGNVNAALVTPQSNPELFDAVKSFMQRKDVKIDHAGERGDEGGGDGEAM